MSTTTLSKLTISCPAWCSVTKSEHRLDPEVQEGCIAHERTWQGDDWTVVIDMTEMLACGKVEDVNVNAWTEKSLTPRRPTGWPRRLPRRRLGPSRRSDDPPADVVEPEIGPHRPQLRR